MSVPPGSTIGIVGGGQLGRMLSMAAAQLGYRCHVYAPDEEAPATEVAAHFTRGAFDDAKALRRFARLVDVATFEFENIPADALAAIAEVVPLFPPHQALEVSQDRLAEKQFIETLGGKPPPYRAVDNPGELRSAIAELGTPAILKTRRFGYDGKGQVRISEAGEAEEAWQKVGGQPCVLEAVVPFEAEFSILLCRTGDGETALWDPSRNTHEGGILNRSVVPVDARFEPVLASAETLARRLAEALEHVGVLCLEFFAVGGEPLFNEMAPRVHNSGHWTIEGALTSQFENHIRAICGLPLGATDRTAPRIEMRNLIGGEVEEWRDILADRTAHLHLYGKKDARTGRKMGHVTRLTGN
ncbi:MAG: 5-(carboxyamino)imidazole ribonucleotide synthase [Sphingosinicella sp.]